MSGVSEGVLKAGQDEKPHENRARLFHAEGHGLPDGVFPAAQRLIGAAANQQQQQQIVGSGQAQQPQQQVMRIVRKQTSGRNNTAGKQQQQRNRNRTSTLAAVGLVEKHMEQIMTVQDPDLDPEQDQDQDHSSLLEPEVQLNEGGTESIDT